MKLSKTMAAIAATVMGVAFLSAFSFGGPSARSVQEVDAIWLDSNVCTSGISQEIHEHGFVAVSSPRKADAVLEVNVRHLDANAGASARYTATLRGADDRVLFSITGREDSITQKELCADIGDDILDAVESRVG